MNEESLRELLDNVKCNNICIIGVLEGEQGIENLFEQIITELFAWPGDGKFHTSSGSKESPNQDEPKETYTKTQHN